MTCVKIVVEGNLVNLICTLKYPMQWITYITTKLRSLGKTGEVQRKLVVTNVPTLSSL